MLDLSPKETDQVLLVAGALLALGRDERAALSEAVFALFLEPKTFPAESLPGPLPDREGELFRARGWDMEIGRAPMGTLYVVPEKTGPS